MIHLRILINTCL